MTARPTIAVYYLDPVGGVRRKYVLPHAHAEQVAHYEWLAQQLATGARYRSVGLYDFAEVDLSTGRELRVEPVRVLQPTAIKTIRIEQGEAAPVQGDLLEGNAA